MTPARRRAVAVAAAVLLALVVAVTVVAATAGDGDGGDGDGTAAPAPSVATTATTEPAGGTTATSDGAAAPSTSGTATTEPDPAPPSTAIGEGDDPNTTVPDTTPEDAVDVEELRALLLDEPGVAAVVPGVVEGGGGPLDLAAAAELEVDAEAERALLQTRRFEGGYNRSFEGPGGAVAYVQVYEFATVAGAEAYLDDGVEEATARGARPFEVTTIDNAVGLTAVDETEVGAFTGHVVTFVRGARHYLVVVGGTDGGPGQEDAGELAAAQLRRVVEAED